MAIFSQVVPLILDLEGNTVSDNPTDYGGKTKYGISKKQFPSIDIDNLTIDGAMKLFEKEYWLRYRLSEICDQSIANQIFLLIINMNPINAGKIVQRAINSSLHTSPCVIDGSIGSNTLTALNSVCSILLGAMLRVEACRYYLALVDNDESQRINFRGWIRRALHE